MLQFPDGWGAVCCDGVPGWRLTDRRGHRNLYGWGSDCCCLQRGKLHVHQPETWAKTKSWNKNSLPSSSVSSFHLCLGEHSVCRRWTSCMQTRSFTETSRVTTSYWGWTVLSNWVSHTVTCVYRVDLKICDTVYSTFVVKVLLTSWESAGLDVCRSSSFVGSKTRRNTIEHNELPALIVDNLTKIYFFMSVHGDTNLLDAMSLETISV